ncbi:MAG: hypothetical protein ACR2N3_00525 [Pyrinomonadaceae bacterium]
MKNSLLPQTAFLLLTILFCVADFWGQRPFVTDNAEVTDKNKFHAEFGNQLNWLQHSAFPVKKQNGFDALAAYGVFKNAEVSFDAVILSLFNDRSKSPRVVSGFGDSTLGFKYNFHQESENSRLPAMSASFIVQFPTGDASRSLGSGVTDYALNFVAQKTLSEKYTLRVNAGTIFAGNTLNGVLGFKARGVIFTGGSSLVRKINDKLQLGAEVSGAVPNNFQLNAGQFQFQTGGNYRIRKKQTLDFGFIAGHFAASPRYSLQLGTSIDF